MADLRLDIATGGDLSGLRRAARALSEAADAANGLSDEGRRAARELDRAAQSGDGVRRAVSAFREASRGANGLSREAIQAAQEIRDIGDAMDSVSRRAVALRAIRIRVQETRETVGRGTDRAGQTLGRGLGALGGMLPGAGALPPQVQTAIGAALVDAVVKAGPLVGAAINGALLAGVGAGGLAAGIALAAKDPRISTAWSGVGKSIMEDLRGDAGAALAGPLVAAASQVKAAWSSVRPVVSGVWAELGPSIQPLVAGALGFVRELAPGLRSAAAAARPIMTMLGQLGPGLGKGLSEIFGSLAAGGEGASRALRFVLQTVVGFGIMAGNTIEWLSKKFDGMFQSAAAIADLVGADGIAEKIRGWGLAGDSASSSFLGLGTAATGAADGITATGEAATTAGVPLMSYSDQLRSSVAPMQDLAAAHLAAEAAIDEVAVSVKENGTSLDIGTAKGRANTEMLQAGILAAQTYAAKAYDAAVANGRQATAAAEARAVYEGYIAQLISAATAAGFNKTQIDALITAYGGLPSDARTNVEAVGAIAAAGEVHGLDNALRGLPRYTYTTIIRDIQEWHSYRSGERGDPAPRVSNGSGGRVPMRAAGGPVMAGRPYIVGEHRPELFVPSSNGTIIPRVPSGGGGAMRLMIDSAGSAMDDLLLELLRRAIKARGGNVQLVIGS